MIQLEAEEKVLLTIRKHKFILFLQSSFIPFFVVGLPVVYALLYKAGYTAILGNDAIYLFAFLYSGVLLLSWIVFFIFWTDYYLDILLVTNKRILDIEQKGFFNRELAIVRLEKVQDITVSVKGVLATFLDFGSLHIQTAAESREFIINDVPNPNKIRKIIYGLHSKILEKPQSVKILGND
jgi:hypothetical protein